MKSKKKTIPYKVGTKLTITQTPQVLANILNRTAEVAWCDDKQVQLNVFQGGMLVLTYSEIKSGVFRFKRQKPVLVAQP